MKIILILSTFLFANIVKAVPSSSVLLDGSVVQCETLADLNKRAFRLEVVGVEKGNIQLRLNTLVCLQVEVGLNQVALFPIKLSEPVVFKNQNDNMISQLRDAKLQITDETGTQVLFHINLDMNVESQQISIKAPSFAGDRLDMTMLSLEMLHYNGQFFDQGVIFSGSYRLILR